MGPIPATINQGAPEFIEFDEEAEESAEAPKITKVDEKKAREPITKPKKNRQAKPKELKTKGAKDKIKKIKESKRMNNDEWSLRERLFHFQKSIFYY